MAFGTLGSTLNDELNRLANGGTYRDMDDMVDEALAAKQWANRENIVPYSTDTVGILNEIAALGPNRQNWFDFNGVCNYLAGTTGLPAAAALRQITTTGDILTSLAAFYTDAATPRYNYPGFIRLDGTVGQFISTPDATALDITGDIDVRVRVAMDNWIPATNSVLMSKYLATGNQRSFRFLLTTSGTLRLVWTTGGVTDIFGDSTVATGIANGSVKWVRATLDVNNGASGYDLKYWLSDNGTSWTQLGTTVTGAGTTSIFSGTSQVEIGSNDGGFLPITGNVYQAQMYASLDGTDKRLDVDLTTNVTSATYDQFTATTGQLCTILGQNTLTNGGSAGSLLPVTVGSSTAADSNDAKFLAHDGTNYVYVPGVSSNFLSVPDAAALDITGDIDLRVQLALDDWTPSASQRVLVKGASGQQSYELTVSHSPAGFLNFRWSTDGTTLNTAASNTTAVPFADGTAGWIRATRVASTGVTKFFTSTDGTTWTQLGTDVSTTAGNIFSGTGNVVIGQNWDGGNPTAGKIYRAQIFNGIDGTKVLDVDTSVITTGAATSFTAVTGQTVTINRSTSGRKTVAVTQPTWLFGTDDYMEVNNRYMAHSTSDENYVYLSGNTLNCLSVADNPPLDVSGDLDIQVKVAADDWTPSTAQSLATKWGYTTNQRSYLFQLFTDGTLRFQWSANGTTSTTINSTVAPTVTDGADLWVRVTLDADNGASGNDIKFYTSSNGTTWTQLGTTITTAGVASLFNSTSQLTIGATRDTGPDNNFKGKFYRAIIKNGIDGTTVLDANAATITLPSQTTFTDSSSNAYTVTINKSGVGTFVSTGNYLYLPGVASNYASAPDSAALDITGDIDLRCKVALDDWTPTGVVNQLVSKWTSSGNLSYQFRVTSAGLLEYGWTSDGTTQTFSVSSVAPTITDGSTLWVRVTHDVDNGSSQNVIQFFTSPNGTTWTQLGTTITNAGVTSIYNSNAILEIGTRGTGTNPARGKFFRAQVLNGIGGTLAFDANFEGSITSLNQASFTESSSNAATVTINRSGSTYRSAGVIDAGYLYPGATNTFANSTIDYLNFGATTSASIVVVARQWATPPNAGSYLTKFGVGNGGYLIQNNGTNQGANVSYYKLSDNTSQGGQTTIVPAAGSLNTYTAVLNKSALTSFIYANTTVSATTAITADDNTNIMSTLRIGIRGNGILPQDMEFIGAAIFRQALTTAQIRQIANYFANREVYL